MFSKILPIVCWILAADFCLGDSITYKVRPECLTKSTNCNLGYFRQESGTNKHIFFSTQNTPSVLILETDRQAEPTWENADPTHPGSIHVPRAHLTGAHGVLLQELILYDDANDTANIDKDSGSGNITLGMGDFIWSEPLTRPESPDTVIARTLMRSENQEHLGGGQITLKLTVSDTHGYSDLLPHLAQKPASLDLSIELDQIDQLADYTSPRFVLTFSVISHHNEQGAIAIREDKSLDDEYTPGIFRSYYIHLPSRTGYFLWKPLTYTKSEKTLETITQSSHSPQLNHVDFAHFPSSILSAFFYTNSTSDTWARWFHVTMGYPEDKFYTHTNYSFWTLSTGRGTRPKESFSATLVGALTGCVALPTIAFLIGAAYISYKKYYHRNSEQDDQDPLFESEENEGD